MSNKDTLYQTFASSLNIKLSTVTDELTYNTIPEWDSTAHMLLVSEIEDVFDVMLDTDDIIDLSSVAKAQEILTKYDINFDD
jgi:acyl carrier protein